MNNTIDQGDAGVKDMKHGKHKPTIREEGLFEARFLSAAKDIKGAD